MNKWIAKYILFLPGHALRGEYTLRYIHEFEKTQWLPGTAIEKAQWQKFLRLIKHTADHSPFYRSLYQAHHVQIDKIRHKEDLLNIPQLTKDDLRYHQQEMRVPHTGTRLSKKTTGGSTGEAVTVLKSRKAMAYQDAAMWRCLRWFDIDIGDKQARFWGTPLHPISRIKNKLIDLVMNRIRLSGWNFSEDSMARFLKRLKTFRPAYYYGYVSMIKEFAQFCERNNINTAPFGLKGIVTTSEPLFIETRQYLQNIFRCPVINDYGSGEVGPIAYDCPEGGFHLMSDNLYFGIINEAGTHAAGGEKGEVVVTELNNFSLPLIRYNLKDIAEVADRPCRCGRGLPLINKILGRDRDVLIADNGTKVHGAYLNQIAQECKRKGWGLKQYQVIQRETDHVVVRIVKDAGYSRKTHQFIEDALKKKLGDNVNIEVKLVDQIKRERSGKLRVVKCEIPR